MSCHVSFLDWLKGEARGKARIASEGRGGTCHTEEHQVPVLLPAQWILKKKGQLGFCFRLLVLIQWSQKGQRK